MSSRSISRWNIAAILILICALLLQVLLAYPVHTSPHDADNVLGGICGINVLHGSRPLMFPGIERFGAFGCYVAAGTFSLFGVSRKSLPLVPLLYLALFLVFLCLYLKEAFGGRAALVGLLLTAVPPVQFLVDYLDIIMCCAAALWVATVLERRRPRPGFFFAFGAVSGFALWCSMLSLAITLPLGLWLLLRRVLTSVSKIAFTTAGVIVGSSPMWVFLVRGGASKWGGDPHLHSVHSLGQIFSNASYLTFTLIPWFFTNKHPDDWSRLSLRGLVMLVYAAAAMVVFIFACWPDSRLRNHPALLSQVKLFGLIVLCFAGLFVFSSAGSLRADSPRYVKPLFLLVPGIAAAICRISNKTWFVATGLGIGVVLFMNLTDYDFPGTSQRKSERAKLLTSEKLVKRLTRDHVQMLLGGYWDVYSLNFDSKEAVKGIPSNPGYDYFGFERTLGDRQMKWALIDHHLPEWWRDLGLSGNVSALGDGRYVFVSGPNPSTGVKILLREAQMLDGPPPLTSFSQKITCSIYGFKERLGGAYTIAVRVKNTGNEPWFAGGRANWVDASYRWFSDNGDILPIEGNRAHLDRPTILPGESDALKLQVIAPPTPGSYKLWISMVQEGVNWFFERGAKPLILKVTVY